MTNKRTRKTDTVRPFRLWDAREKHDMHHRYYCEAHRAHDAALILVRWGKVGNTLEVYDCTTGRLLGQYTRKIDGISYVKG